MGSLGIGQFVPSSHSEVQRKHRYAIDICGERRIVFDLAYTETTNELEFKVAVDPSEYWINDIIDQLESIVGMTIVRYSPIGAVVSAYTTKVFKIISVTINRNGPAIPCTLIVAGVVQSADLSLSDFPEIHAKT